MPAVGHTVSNKHGIALLWQAMWGAARLAGPGAGPSTCIVCLFAFDGVKAKFNFYQEQCNEQDDNCQQQSPVSHH